MTAADATAADATATDATAAPAPKLPILLVIAVSVAMGVAMGVIFLLFEWLVNHGDTFIWDDVFQTEDHRWVVVPLAVVLSLLFSLLVHAVGQKRIVPIHLSLVDELGGPVAPATVRDIWVTLAVGLGSLLAGASLGPEAALVATSMALGAWVSFRFGLSSAAEVLVLASMTALLVAFFGSVVPLLIPPLLIYKKTKTLPIAALVPPTLAGLAAYATLYVIRGDVEGYGTIPAGDSVDVTDFVLAFVLGICAVGVGYLLRQSIYILSEVAKGINDRLSWAGAAALFGLGLGVLYLIGGETVQFSGSAGTKLLLNDTQYGTAALAGIVLVKILATAWSLSAGYRGGLVFPSVFTGVALSLCVVSAFGGTTETGLMIGSVAGILVEMTSPALGAIMLLSLLPAELLPLGLAGALGAVIPHAAYRRMRPKPPEVDAAPGVEAALPATA